MQTPVMNMQAARQERLEAHRAYLLSLAPLIEFPGGQLLDQVTNEPMLDEVARSELERLFKCFGLTELSPDDKDFEKVVNTWLELTSVAGVLQSRVWWGEKLHQHRLAGWTPAYGLYLEALWNGDAFQIERQARALGIEAGIPDGSTSLKKRAA